MTKFIVIGLFVMSHFYGVSQLSSSQKGEVIDSILTECNKREIFNGVVLIADKGEVILSKAYGVKNLETKEELTVQNRFYIGGLTKQFTAALIFKLYQAKKINIKLPIGKYLPVFKDKKYKYITVYHLLTHTSGLSAYEEDEKFNREKDYSKEEIYSMIQSKPLQFKAGTNFKYSNSGYYLLGVILEKLSRKSFHELLNDEILMPLKMTNSGFDTSWLKTNVANEYYRNVDGYDQYPTFSLSTLFSAGGMYSTANDLFKWDKALYGDKILSSEMKEIMFKPFLNNFACAWRVESGVEDDDENTYFERHQMGGISAGFNTYMLRRVPQKQTVILFDNFYNAEILYIKNSIWAVLDNRQGWVPRPMLSILLYKKIIQGYLPQTVSWLAQNREDYERLYVFEEYDINQVGYKLFKLGRLTEARQIFEFNILLFPNAWNVYDSYAELLLESGELQESKKMYQKSLEINPVNENAKLSIQKIDALKY